MLTQNITDMLSKLDYSNRDVEYRLNILNDILYGDNYKLNDDLIEYLDNINVNINQNNDLISNNKIVKMLEKMADYLLYAKKENDKVNYKIYTYTELSKRATKENRMIGMIIKELYFDYANKVNNNEIVFIKYFRNELKIKTQKITKQDLKMMPELKEYEVLKENIKKELKTLDGKDIKNKKRKSKLRNLYGEIVTDQILFKDSILGTIYFKNISTVNIKDDSYIPVDYEHNILAILKCESNTMTNIGCMAYDLNNIINTIQWSELELEIIKLYKNGKTIMEIAYSLFMEYRKLYKKINTICKRITTAYNKYYKDWFNETKRKAKYETCNKCSQIFLKHNMRYHGRHIYMCIKCYKECKKK